MYKIIIKIFCLLSLIVSQELLTAQVIDNTSTYETVHQKSYFRLYYDNDFFTKADYYYSQGITLEYVYPGLRKNPLNRIFFRLANSYDKYGITVNLFGYTPTSILSDSILFGDRPYEAAICLKSFKIATDTVNRNRLSSSLSIGLFGQGALGNEIQTGIHRWLKNPLPHGWQYQVHNDLLLNYQLNYEKALLAKKHFLLNGCAELRMGTYEDKLNAGFNFMAGNFNDPYKENNAKKVAYYLYGQARGNFIGYDASMQGGLINRNSPYTIPTKNLERATFQADAGIVVQFKKLYLCYSQSYLTREFNTGKYHRWGGFSVGFSL